MPAFDSESPIVLTIVHQATSVTGRIGRQLASLGYQQERRCPNTGCGLPDDLERYAAVVVFGGPMSANDDATLPCIEHEMRWLERVLDSGMPYLGVCLGAQLLARVMGAEVREHPDGAAEIGYYPIHATEAGADLFDSPLVAYQWHREGFELPAGAELLATSEMFRNQAFRASPGVYGLQFHPEVTRDIMQRWLKSGVRRLGLPGAQTPELQRAENLRHDASMERWLSKFLDHWLDRA